MKGPNVGDTVEQKMNLGCGDDIKEGWVNVDTATDVLNRYEYGTQVEGWNAIFPPPDFYQNRFDFILINHVLCTLRPDKAMKVLEHALWCLKDGGKVQVIDVDMLRAFKAYQSGDEAALFIPEGSIDYKLAMHLSGYGTRLSLYTEKHLSEQMFEAGFSSVDILKTSEFNTRPLESLIVEGTR